MLAARSVLSSFRSLTRRWSLLFLIVFLLPTISLADLKAPKLSKVSLVGENVHLTFRVPKKYRKKPFRLVVQKAPSGWFFSSVAEHGLKLSKRKRNGIRKRLSKVKVKLPANDTGTYFFRGQLLSSSGNSSKWSAARSVSVSEPQENPGEDNPSPPTAPEMPELLPGQSLCDPEFEQGVVDSTNSYRVLAGVGTVERHPLLDIAARTHSIQMASSGTLSHDNWFDHLMNVGMLSTGSTHFAQNVAFMIDNSATLVGAWVDSPEHSGNIYDADSLYIGVSCVKDQDGYPWHTQYFSN